MIPLMGIGGMAGALCRGFTSLSCSGSYFTATLFLVDNPCVATNLIGFLPLRWRLGVKATLQISSAKRLSLLLTFPENDRRLAKVWCLVKSDLLLQ